MSQGTNLDLILNTDYLSIDDEKKFVCCFEFGGSSIVVVVDVNKTNNT